MNTREAARYLLVTPAEIRRLVRIGYLPYSVRQGRFSVDRADLDRLAADLPDQFQPVPSSAADFIEALTTGTCDELAAIVEPFNAVVGAGMGETGLMRWARQRGCETAARNAVEATSQVLEKAECSPAIADLAFVGVLTLLVESLGEVVPGRDPTGRETPPAEWWDLEGP